MKKFSLKKITAAVSAAAMIATMCTSAFAADPASGAIEITNVLHSVSGNVHTFTIQYTAGDVQDIGITMFSYAGKEIPVLNKNDHDNFDASKALDSAEQPYKVVGVDQVANTTEKTGEISFKVSTDDTTAPIYMEEGQTGLVKLGGDKVNAPAIATFTIPVAPFDAVVVDANLSSDEFDFGTEVAELKAAVLDRINNVTAFADAAKTGKSDIGTKKTSLDASKVTIQKKTSGDPIPYAKGLAGTFTVTIPATEFEFASVNASSLTDKNVSFDIVVKKDTWTATEASLVDGNNLTAEVTQTADKLKEELKGRKIALKGADNKLHKISIVESWISEAVVDDTNKTVTFKITVPAGNYGDDNVTVKVEAAKEFDVVYKLTDLTKIIDPATLTLTYDGNALTADSTGAYAVEVEKGTEDPTAKAVIGLKNKKDQVAEVDTAYTLSAWTSEPTYAKDTPGVYTFTTTITPAEDYSLDGGAATKVVTLKVTVKDGKKIILGDIDCDGKADDLDYSAFYNHYTGISPFAALTDPSTDNYKAADIDGNGTVDDLDYSAYYNHYTGISVNPNIGNPVKN